MKRSLRLAVCAGVVLSSACAWAMPPAMDRAPADAMLVVAVPSLSKLDKNANELAGIMGLPAGFGLSTIKSMIGMEQGVADEGSAALVYLGPPAEGQAGGQGEDAMFIIAPVSDYKSFVSNFGATAADGVVEGKIKDDETFFRDIGGGYAAFGPRKDVIEKLDAKGGHNEKFTALLGTVGSEVADQSDIVVVFNVENSRDLIRAGVQKSMEEMGRNMAAMGQEGGPDTKKIVEFVDRMAGETRGLVLGASFSTTGLVLHGAANFTKDSSLAQAMATPGDSAGLMGKLPTQPFLFAFAMDTSAPAIKSLLKQMAALQPNQGEGSMMDFASLIEKYDGQATSMGVPAGGIMGGLMTKTVQYMKTSDPAGSASAIRTGLEQLGKNGKATVKYVEAAQEIAGTKVDSFEIKLQPDASNPMAAQGMAMMFGMSGGPAGFLAKTEGGIVQTYGKSKELMEAALAAASASATSSSDEGVKQVGAILPKGRFIEGYAGVKSILDSVLPFMSMMGMNIDTDIPENLPPIGGGFAPDRGQLRMGLVVPAPVLKTGFEIGQAVQQAQAGGPGGAEDAPDRDDSEEEPRF